MLKTPISSTNKLEIPDESYTDVHLNAYTHIDINIVYLNIYITLIIVLSECLQYLPSTFEVTLILLK